MAPDVCELGRGLVVRVLEDAFESPYFRFGMSSLLVVGFFRVGKVYVIQSARPEGKVEKADLWL